MNVNEAIRGRRSISRFQPDPVPSDQLARLLEAGIWAPNHHLTEPWRFIVIGPQTRGRLTERYGDLRAERVSAEATERRERVRQDSVAKFLAIPTLVAVATEQVGDAQRQAEDYAATCCAVQNIQLAAWAEGVGMKWSTSEVTRDPLAYSALGLDPQTMRIIGFLYVGFPADVPSRPRQKPLNDVILWTD
jgi:nitroreductase